MSTDLGDISELDSSQADHEAVEGNRKIRKLFKVIFKISLVGLPDSRQQNPRFNTKRSYLERTYMVIGASLFFACVAVLGRTLYYHYIYEYYLFRYATFNESRPDSSATMTIREQSEQSYLIEKINSSRYELDAVGSPLFFLTKTVPFGAVCFYLNWIGIGFSVYIIMVIYLYFVSPLETSFFLRVVTEPRRELQQADQLIKRLVSEINSSSLHYTEAKIRDNIESHHLKDNLSSFAYPRYKNTYMFYSNIDSCNQHTWKLIHEHYKYARNVIRLASKGRLNPVRESVEWFDALALISSTIVGGTYVVIVVSLVASPWMYGFDLRLKWADNIVLFALLLETLVFSLAGVFYLASLAVTIIDRIKSVRLIHAKAMDCITRNNEIFSNWPTNPKDEHIVELKQEANDRLLMFLLEYKIFAWHLRDFYAILGFIGCAVRLNIFVMPTVLIFHSTYLRHRMLRIYLIMESVTVAGFLDILVFASCFFHSRIAKFHKTLTSLMAHVLVNQGRYQEHTVLLLRNECHEVERLNNHCPSYSFTHTRALTMHFYLGIVLLATFFNGRISSQNYSNQLLINLFNDPLGFYRQSYTDVVMD